MIRLRPLDYFQVAENMYLRNLVGPAYFEVLDFIVDKAIEYKLGARGLRSIVESIMIDAMYEMPSATAKELRITLPYAEEKFSKTSRLHIR